MTRTRLLLLLGAALPLAACGGADDVASPGDGVIVVPAPSPGPGPSPTPTPPAPGQPAASCPAGTTDVGVIGSFRSCRIPSLITGSLTLQRAAGVAYEMNGRVDVGVDIGAAGNAAGGSSATLTVQPGVLIYANTTNAENDFLVVNRGSRLNAEGTESLPIIFTAQQNLTGGVTDASQGLWGGVILAGRAPISNCLGTAAGGTVDCENIVEGTVTARYGGASPDDNSGVLRYVQIRYSGTIISQGNELQGLTLGGVGRGTQISHIQVHNSSDDGVEIFGGTVNMRYLVVTGADDDSIDTDVGWQGFIQFALAAQRPGSTQGDNYIMEIDSNGNEDALPRQFGRIANFTFIHTTTGTNAAIRLRGGADFTFVNGIVTSQRACLNTVAGFEDASGKSTIRPANAGLQDQGPPVFNSVVFGCATNFAETAVNNITVTNAEQQTFFNAGTNNTLGATNVLASVFLPSGVAATTTAFQAATLNPSGTSFFVNTNYIGAVRDANDVWFRNWTCNSSILELGSSRGACTAIPTS